MISAYNEHELKFQIFTALAQIELGHNLAKLFHLKEVKVDYNEPFIPSKIKRVKELIKYA